jgi:cytoskeletal protein CcmA (bactofilin family)
MKKFDRLEVYGTKAGIGGDFGFLEQDIATGKEMDMPSSLRIDNANLLAEGKVSKNISVVDGALKAPEIGDGVIVRAVANSKQKKAVKLPDNAEKTKRIYHKTFLRGEKKVSNAIDILGDVGKNSYLLTTNGSIHVGGDIGKGALISSSSNNSTVHVEGQLDSDVIIDVGETGKIVLDKQPSEDCRFICDSLNIEGKDVQLNSDGSIIKDQTEQVKGQDFEKVAEQKTEKKLLPEPIKPPQLLISYQEEEIPESLIKDGDVKEGEELTARKRIQVEGKVSNGANLTLTEPDDKSVIHVKGRVDGAANFDAGKEGNIVLNKFPNLDSRFKCGNLYVGAVVNSSKDGGKTKKPEILRAKCKVDDEGKAIINPSVQRFILGSERAD